MEFSHSLSHKQTLGIGLSARLFAFTAAVAVAGRSG
jgi:hypothetical protein